MRVDNYSTARPTIVNSLITFLNKIKNINSAKIKKHIFKRIPFVYLRINFPSFILAGGSQTLINYKPPIGEKLK